MLKKDNRSKLLELFFQNPSPHQLGFQLREISRKISLAPKSVKNYLGELEKENLIRKEKHRIHKYPLYYANRENDYFKLLKKLHTIRSLTESGLIQDLIKTQLPDNIILFGSCSRGEDTEESDIDLYLGCKEKPFDRKKFEKKLKRHINIFFDQDINNVSKELRNNIVNGDRLYGYLQIWKD